LEIAWNQLDLEMMEGILVPGINSVSLWLVDDHLWKPVNPTKININGVENFLHKCCYQYSQGVGAPRSRAL
jgi:hypothetical protein